MAVITQDQFNARKIAIQLEFDLYRGFNENASTPWFPKPEQIGTVAKAVEDYLLNDGGK